MIQKFKRKTILVLTIIFWIILIGILLAVNLSNYQSNLAETGRLLTTQEKLSQSEHRQEVIAPVVENKKLSRIYTVRVEENERFEIAFTNDNSDYSDDQLIHIAKDMLKENKRAGTINHFRYKVTDTDYGRMISFIDYSIWEHQQYWLMIYSLLIGIVGIVFLFFVAFFLTRWLVKPIIAAFEKQKQFISDAGHELKTPLTVMKSSLDMLEHNFGENKYFGYLREENTRMTVLVHELLSLSRLENDDAKVYFEKVDLSRVVEGTCLPFECLAFEKGLRLELQIQEGIHIKGDEKQIRQMIEVLVDNGIKHTYTNGTVFVQLKKEKGKKTLLFVKNEGEPIPEIERRKIFDRFYRVDKARNRSEGRYGLGLAIASSIAEVHSCRISVECKENWTTFCVKFN